MVFCQFDECLNMASLVYPSQPGSPFEENASVDRGLTVQILVCFAQRFSGLAPFNSRLTSL